MDGVLYVQPKSNPPTIKEMLDWFYDDSGQYVAIVNADIRLEHPISILTKINQRHGNVWAATSLRYDEFNGEQNVVDMGLDFFAFPKNVASSIRGDIPEYLTLGRGGWDNWMNGWLSKNLPREKYYDLTDHKFVIHPRHTREDNRLEPYSESQVKETFSHPRIKLAGVPRKKINR